MRLVAGIPPSFPTGVCYICGSDPGSAPVIATDIVIEFEGELSICGNCWADGAALLGFATPETVDRLKAENAALKQKVKTAETRASADLGEKVMAALS